MIKSPYLDLTPGRWCEYAVMRTSGHYNRSTGQLDVNSSAPTGERVRRTVCGLPGLPFPAVALVETSAGVSAPPGPPWSGLKVLYNGLWQPPSGAAFIGEFGGPWSVGFPPEAELALDPTPGEIIAQSSSGWEFDPASGKAKASSGPWKYRTIGVGPGPGEVWWLGQWPGQLLTLVEENPGVSGAGNKAFGYLYSKACGGILLDMFWTAEGIGVDGQYSGGLRYLIVGTDGVGQ